MSLDSVNFGCALYINMIFYILAICILPPYQPVSFCLLFVILFCFACFSYLPHVPPKKVLLYVFALSKSGPRGLA